MASTPAIIWYDEVESTNDTARKTISDLDNMSVIAARRQTAGRGQGDHKWSSTPGLNLTCTFVLRLGLRASDAQYITKVTTRAICDYLADNGIATRVKLPNDIYVGEMKICGILIENIVFGKSLQTSIVGIGLNMSQERFEEWIPNPISMKLLTGKDYDPARELKSLQGYMMRSASMLETQDRRTALDDWFSANSFRRDV